MDLRLAVYAEGPADIGSGLLPPPGHPLAEGLIGPVHVLLKRLLQAEVPERRAGFVAPLRYRGRRTAKGSDFKDKTILKQLLSWPTPSLRPDLAVVVVDSDGDRQIGTRLKRIAGVAGQPTVIGVAVKELEAWLIADGEAVAAVAGAQPPQGRPERMAPRVAKDALQELLRTAHHLDDEVQARRSIAATCSLERLASRCPSFSRFRGDLRATLAAFAGD